MANADDVVRTERLFRRKAVTRHLKEKYDISLSEKTLAKWACTSSDGPPFRMFGRTPVYPEAELDAWVERRLGPVVRSTSEAESYAKALATAKRPLSSASRAGFAHTTGESDPLKAVPDE
jgi:hypothetical protein